MNWFESWALNSGIVKAWVSKIIAKAAAVAATVVIVLISKGLTHFGFDITSGPVATDLAKFGTEIGATVIIALSLLWDLRDAKRVDVALNASAQTGQVVKPSQAPAIVKGEAISLPDGQTVVIGKPSPANQTEAQEQAETAALNKAQLPK